MSLSAVLADPCSFEARAHLASAWEAAGDPRGALLRQLLELHELERINYNGPGTIAARVAARALLRDHRAALVGDVAKHVLRCELVRGLVGRITIAGDDLPAIAPRVFGIAPIQHLVIVGPVTRWNELVESRYFAHIACLTAHELGLGDREAAQLAGSPHAFGLRWIDLGGNRIGHAGLEQLAASPALARVAYLNLVGNPADPSPRVGEVDDRLQLIRPSLARDLADEHGDPPWLVGPQHTSQIWPPDPDYAACER